MINRTDPVVVGFDSTKASRLALNWAAQVAARRQVPLSIVYAVGDEQTGFGFRQPKARDLQIAQAQHAVDRAVTSIEQQFDIKVAGFVEHDNPAKALCDYSQNAALVVVGHQSRGALRGVLLGSVAFATITHANCPVAVVRGANLVLPTDEYPIVAGVDGSKNSFIALEHAADLAVDTQAPLRIAVALAPLSDEFSQASYQYIQGSPRGLKHGNPWQKGSEQSLYDEVMKEVQESAEKLSKQAEEFVHERYPNLTIELVILPGRPQEIILDLAGEASLIVVGARGQGGFGNLMLGSVSRHIVQQAPCPVMVIR